MVHSGRLAGIALAFAAMLLRALLPAGWMPNPGGTSGSPLVVCTMDGPGRMMAGMGAMGDMGGAPADRHHDRNSQHDHPVCPFAAAPHLAPPAATAALAIPSTLARAELRTAWIDVAKRPARHSPQSPRAPPESA